MNNKNKNNLNGFTLIDALIGSFLILLVFLGIFGAYQLAIKVMRISQNKTVALYIIQGEMEKIKNLPYKDIGVVGGFPDGVIEETREKTINNIDFTIKTRIDYIADSTDGLYGEDDDCPNDYKKITITVYSEGSFGVNEYLTMDISPKTIGEECEEEGGILFVSVFNSYGEMVNSPLIEVKNFETGEILKDAIPDSGEFFFLLPEGKYLVEVSKDGYSKERTYGIEEVAVPEKSHPIITNGLLSDISFQIDLMGSMNINTLSPWGIGYYFDQFEDGSKILDSENIILENGNAILETGHSFGFLKSIVIFPDNLINWHEFSFNHSLPEGTEITYYLMYQDELISNSDLPGNETGFIFSPIDLSVLDVNIYNEISILAEFKTNNSSAPFLHGLELSFINEEATPIGNVSFQIRGNKKIGFDEDENPIYKYIDNFVSNQGGVKEILEIEPDLYFFEVENLVLINNDPVGLLPAEEKEIFLYLMSDNSLFITVLNEDTSNPVFSAKITLTKNGFEKVMYTNEKGQTFFSPIDSGNYLLLVEGPGYENFSENISLAGDTIKNIKIKQIE